MPLPTNAVDMLDYEDMAVSILASFDLLLKLVEQTTGSAIRPTKCGKPLIYENPVFGELPFLIGNHVATEF
ncbi:hypothetical protein SBA_ch1_23110 [Sphingomonas bisphenolicum]|uniref:Uncharacterized protein n=1 Tax=Sphingomonas bisphenolicum TaxID=296544 RepID=A0ABN5WKM9_9SPHN|nr:hypothetical protein SBA_ch1_23110 [Sphingomonas bisphenolicum]